MKTYVRDRKNAITRAKRALKEEGLVVLFADGNDIPICTSVARSILSHGHADYYHIKNNCNHQEIRLVTMAPGTAFPISGDYWRKFVEGSNLIYS